MPESLTTVLVLVLALLVLVLDMFCISNIKLKDCKVLEFEGGKIKICISLIVYKLKLYTAFSAMLSRTIEVFDGRVRYVLNTLEAIPAGSV